MCVFEICDYIAPESLAAADRVLDRMETVCEHWPKTRAWVQLDLISPEVSGVFSESSELEFSRAPRPALRPCRDFGKFPTPAFPQRLAKLHLGGAQRPEA
jgi:hypothetical protein